MSARRVTIGLKPVDDQPAPPAASDTTSSAADPAAGILEQISAKAAGTKPLEVSAEAWVRRGSEATPAPAVATDGKPADPSAAAWVRSGSDAVPKPAANAEAKPTQPSVDTWLRRLTEAGPVPAAPPPPPAAPLATEPQVAPTAVPATSIAAVPPETLAIAPTVPTEPEPAEPPTAATSAEAAPAAATRLPDLRGLLISAAVGAVVAVLATMLLLPSFTPSVESRLAPVVDRIAQVEALAKQAGETVGQLNNEVAQAIDADTAVAGQIAAQATEIAEIRARLDQSAARAIQTGADPSVFAVAVAQMRAAFYAGRPFEAELINVYTMVRADERFRGLMNELSSPARGGLPSAAVMRQQFRAYVAAAGLVIGGPKTYIDYGMSLLDQYVGLSTELYAMQVGHAAATEADRRLMNGDVAGAVQLLVGLDPAVAAPLQPWLTNARIYLRAESAVTELTAAAVDSLRKRMESPGAG